MRIEELFENTQFDQSEFVKKGENKIDYDLAEDLTFFMNNDDDIYRAAVYPAVAKCQEALEKKKSFKPSVFKQAALESYAAYIKKFPIRELPKELDDTLCNEVCARLYKDVYESLSNAKD